MVHALKEARRVLKPNGVLIDLRPAPIHRRVGISRGGRWKQLGVMQERFDDDRTANRAVLQVLRGGLLKREWRTQFDCPRVMDTFDEFRAWLDEFVRLGNMPTHDWLLERVASALANKPGQVKVVVRGPLMMQVMRKAQD
jgi:hypothetical protein